MKIKNIAALLATSILAMSCGDDDNDSQPSQPDPTQASVRLHYDFKFGSEDFALNQYYGLAGGEQVKFSTATFYLSQPTFEDDAELKTSLSPEYIIVRPETQMTKMEDIDPGHVHLFKVSIGIDEATNTEDGATGVQPSDFTDANHPLAPQPEGMYWSWASGYIFVNMEGEIDYDGDGQADTSFTYHLGTNAFRKDRSLMIHSNAVAGEPFDLKMSVDYERVFDGLDLQTEVFTKSMGDARPLGIKVMDNFDAAVSFSAEENNNHGKTR